MLFKNIQTVAVLLPFLSLILRLVSIYDARRKSASNVTSYTNLPINRFSILRDTLIFTFGIFLSEELGADEGI